MQHRPISSSAPARPEPRPRSRCTGKTRRWRRDLVLEKARHPRPKVCAGGLIPAGRRWLAAHDVSSEVPHVTVHRALVTTPAATVAHDDRRPLLRRAPQRVRRLAGAGLPGARHRGTRGGAGARAGARRRTACPSRRPAATYHARLVIGADGSGSVVRRSLVDPGRAEQSPARSWPTFQSMVLRWAASRSNATTSTSASCARPAPAIAGRFPA